ncbi:MAG: hypothetical protein C5B55_12405 [Blastocatellia bacterium]|nr:MAG: hypothetical protein C5B55_12405 [Blastocatellia bacterium]
MTSRRGRLIQISTSSTSPHSNKNSFPLPAARYLFFGGKGGVGKTTAAAATALFLLSKAKFDEAFLLFSTDPAHSLSDSLGMKIGDRLVTVEERKRARLVAYEMDATLALERFKEMHGKVLAEIAERGTFLDETDIKELLNLSLPGLDEVMALFELSELDRSGVYSRVVVDTAPSGHTSRLLRLPDVFKRVSHALDLMAEKHRYIVAQFARGGNRLDDVDLFLRDLNERIERVRKLLFDKATTSFTLVAIPEAMSVFETERYAALLEQEGVPITNLIVNRVEHEHSSCSFCKARVAMQKPWLEKLERTFRGLSLRHVPLLVDQVNGLESLKEFGKLLWLESKVPRSLKLTAKHETRRSESDEKFSLPSRRLLIFGGKGGVGKTTAAAATALALAEENPDSKILVFSTDPAHSLSDSFDEIIGESKTNVAGKENLDAMEIDSGRWFADLKRRYQTWTDQLFESLRGNSKFEIQFEREAMRELVELTPPGIDEIAALGTVSDLLENGHYDTIVLDTAPTGHLVRFLELPQAALAWVRTFIKLLLKYQHVVHATQVAEELVALSRTIKTVLALLTDTRQCEFVAVAIPEKMSFDETMGLSRSLNTLNVPFTRVIINGLIPDHAASECGFCQSRRESQDKVLAQFRREFGRSFKLYAAKQKPNEIRGAKLLRDHFSGWTRLSGQTRRVASVHLQRSAKALKDGRQRRAQK